MAILKSKDIVKMNVKEIEGKIKELRIESIKAQVAGKKGGKANIREIRRTIARLYTIQAQINKKQETKK
jgi:ribosomal protein L29